MKPDANNDWAAFNAVIESREATIAELVEALTGLVECTHRPNPTDQTRIDVAPGKHRTFQAAIETARAALARASKETGE